MFCDKSSSILKVILKGRGGVSVFPFLSERTGFHVKMDAKSHEVTIRLITFTVVCGLLRACGAGTFKAMNEISPSFSTVYLNLFFAGLGYFVAGLVLRKIHKEKQFKPTKRDLAICGLNSFMGAIVQGLFALAFIKGASVGGPEYVGQWITILVVVTCTRITQKRHPNIIQMMLILLVAFGATLYIIGDPIVEKTNSLPSWMIISFACAILGGLCISTYNWWLEHSSLGLGSAMCLSGTISMTLGLIIYGGSCLLNTKICFPLNTSYWLYSISTVSFWAVAGIFATEVCLGKLLSSIRQSITMGSQLIGAIIIGSFFFDESPALAQWPGIVLIIGSIFMMVYIRQKK